MIDFRSLQIEHFCEQVEYQHKRIYGGAEAVLLQNTLNISRMALAKMAISNSLFLNINHTKRAGIVALQILDGVLHQRGVVEPPLFFNLILGTLISHVGVVGGVLEEDEVKPSIPTEKYYIGKGKYKTFEGPSSNSVLWPNYISRSLIFVDRNFRSMNNLNIEDVKSAIKVSDLANKTNTKDTTILCQFVRASHLMAFLSQSQYNQWLVRLYRSLEEADLTDRFGFDHLGEFREKFGQYVWENFFSDLTSSIPLLNETGEGKELVATVYSRIG